MTITGRTVEQELEKVAAQRAGPGGDRPFDDRCTARAPGDPEGKLSTEGCVAKITGLKKNSITGPARVFDSRTPRWKRSWPTGYGRAT